MTPRATARLQLYKDFGFDRAAETVPYLAQLGISHLYLSPILKARPGSAHGYDTVDHAVVNPELGGEEALQRLVRTVRRHEMGLIVDIVPNHMAVARENRHWLDVLEKGQASASAAFFDIDWESRRDAEMKGRVLAPFLGEPPSDVLRKGELSLRFDADAGRICAVYGDHRFPVRLDDYDGLLADIDELAPFAADFAEARGNLSAVDGIRRRLADACGAHPRLAAILDRKLEGLRADSTALAALLDRQNYRLAFWKTAACDINWRRFFDITDLIGVRVEIPEVFEVVHAVAFRLYQEGWIDGVRVDHVDGLADPTGYCRQLRARLDDLRKKRPALLAQSPAYFVVEKILARDESLPEEWPVDGTTGYEFMNETAALFHDENGAEPLGRLWSRISGRTAAFEEEEWSARIEILLRTFPGQLDDVVEFLFALARGAGDTPTFTRHGLARALTALLAEFRCYRGYVTPTGARPADVAALDRVAKAARQGAAFDGEALDWVVAFLKGEAFDAALHREAMIRFQQLSAPLAAKAVEDTAFYRYGRLLSRNDVGSDPMRVGTTSADFHAFLAERQKRLPRSLLATATHDHKRGEDVRARLAVLSELPAFWEETAEGWFEMNGSIRPSSLAPSDEYMLYQAIVGSWPLELDARNAAGVRAFATRLAGWQQKALREGKLHSSWTAPDEEYETAAAEFLRALFDAKRSEFTGSVAHFVSEIAAAGALNGLGQALLRCTVPGIPDLYQGCEFWDFSFVDPDNRRAVDYLARGDALSAGRSATECIRSWRDGAVKQAVIAAALGLRRRWPDLFAEGEIERLEAEGAEDRVVAFTRRLGDRVVVVAIARQCATALRGHTMPVPPPASWGDATLAPPAELHLGYRDALARTDATHSGARLRLADLFKVLPVALLCTRNGAAE